MGLYTRWVARFISIHLEDGSLHHRATL